MFGRIPWSPLLLALREDSLTMAATRIALTWKIIDRNKIWLVLIFLSITTIFIGWIKRFSFNFLFIFFWVGCFHFPIPKKVFQPVTTKQIVRVEINRKTDRKKERKKMITLAMRKNKLMAKEMCRRPFWRLFVSSLFFLSPFFPFFFFCGRALLSWMLNNFSNLFLYLFFLLFWLGKKCNVEGCWSPTYW